MTPKEKADEFMRNYAFQLIQNGSSRDFETIKSCAALAVEIIIVEFNRKSLSTTYWDKVLTEIKNM